VRDQRAALRRLVAELAAIERPSASAGERAAAERIAEELARAGARAHVDEERAHGGYWWPVGLLNAAAAAAGWRVARKRTGRTLAFGAGAFAAIALADDLGGGSMWFRRRFLPHRPTWNVVGEIGDPDADRTVVFVAHHDAARSGLVFHPALARLDRRGTEGRDRSFPILRATWAGPALVALGSLVPPLAPVGVAFATGTSLVMADIGMRGVVPGANDNLSAVAVIVGLARRLRERPVAGTRVLLVSTGSEESFSEGMRGFARRHFPALPRERTEIVCVECVGSPDLHILEGEGMLRMRDYPRPARDALAAAAERAAVEVRRGWRTVAATDALVALRAGYHVATLAALDATMLPANYHWPTDVEGNLAWETIEDALDVCEHYVRGRARPDPAAMPDCAPCVATAADT
jgi:acetylornithine deacetylase/succinyl-diaminopimelate desuccinylase-like protein